MSYPQKNDTISIAFIGKLDNGEIFYTVSEDKPMKVIIGNSELPPTLENAVSKLNIGQTTKVRVPPEEGYGHRSKALLQVINSEKMIESLSPKPGMILSLKVDKNGQEEQVPATVIEVKGSEITVDYNHPLAGHHLTYEVTLVDFTRAPQNHKK